MAVTVAVLIPFRPDGEQRTANLTHVLAHWAPTGWQVSVADDGDRDQPWCKARAIARAHRSTRANVYVVSDADVTCDLDAVREAVEQVIDRGGADVGHHWAMPHHLVRRLDQRSTEHVLAGRQAASVARSPYEGFEGGGMTVIRSETLLACPPDPRFLGWGDEDLCWGMALRCLFGEPWRGDAQLIHLWHPPAPELAANNKRSPRPESRELTRRYRAARSDPDRMRALLAELA